MSDTLVAGVTGEAMTLSVSVIIPTYRRPDDLKRCLLALQRQVRAPFEVVVIYRAGDEPTLDILRAFAGRLPLRPAFVGEPGQVAALNRGLDIASGDIVAIIDDDTAPHADWTLRIARHFDRDPALTGLGGRDYVHDDRMREKTAVGKIRLWGSTIGNHHLGVGAPRPVDMLKGANMSFRRRHLGGLRFETRLLGSGAQADNDLAFCLALRRAGRRLVYDPRVAVDHYPGTRRDGDGRGGASFTARVNQAHNRSLIMLGYLPPWRGAIFVIWSALVGERSRPGLLQLLRLLFTAEPDALAYYRAAQRGLFGGARTWLRTR